jgi:hypothetical protein
MDGHWERNVLHDYDDVALRPLDPFIRNLIHRIRTTAREATAGNLQKDRQRQLLWFRITQRRRPHINV